MRAGKIASFILVLSVSMAAAVTRLLCSWLFGTPDSLGMELTLFAATLAAILFAVLLPLGFVFDRTYGRLQAAFKRLSDGVDTSGSLLIAGGSLSTYLQPLLRNMTEAIEQFHQKQGAMKAQINELEIRHRVSEAQRRQTEAVLHALRDAVLVSDAFDDLVLANEVAAAILQFDPSICKGGGHQSLAVLVKNEQIRHLVREVRNTADFANPRKIEMQIGERHFDVTLICVENHKHEVSGVVTILHDLTREREISQMKSDFVSKASHELRTPLSSIRAYVEMLVDGEAGDEAGRQDFYRVIQGETDRLGRLIDNMLNISRIEAGIVQIQREMVDVRVIMERAVAAMTPAAVEKKIALNLSRIGLANKPIGASTIGDQSLSVEGDPDMLYQVMLNLISNAVKYTPDGGRITIGADAEGLGGFGDSKTPNRQMMNSPSSPSVVVSVTDTGLGIPPEAMPQMFGKFFRIENYKRLAKGTGLGLSLCKHIVETVHYGQIGVESKLGMGSKFWFSIPMKYAGKKAA